MSNPPMEDAWELTVAVPEAYADVLTALTDHADELSTATNAPTHDRRRDRSGR